MSNIELHQNVDWKIVQNRATQITMAGWLNFWWWSTATLARWTAKENINMSFWMHLVTSPKPVLFHLLLHQQLFCNRCLRFSPQYRSEVRIILPFWLTVPTFLEVPKHCFNWVCSFEVRYRKIKSWAKHFCTFVLHIFYYPTKLILCNKRRRKKN